MLLPLRRSSLAASPRRVPFSRPKSSTPVTAPSHSAHSGQRLPGQSALSTTSWPAAALAGARKAYGDCAARRRSGSRAEAEGDAVAVAVVGAGEGRAVVAALVGVWVQGLGSEI